MFPLPESRIRSLFRRSVDAAIDFATLGEYGLASAWEDPAPAGSGTATRARQDNRLAVRVGAPATLDQPRDGRAGTAVLLQPASAAGQARRNEERRVAGLCAGQPLRGRALERQLPRAARSRDGMAPREQGCLIDAG